MSEKTKSPVKPLGDRVVVRPLTEEELAETDFENTEDIVDALDEVEDDIEDGGIDFVYGCSDNTACNYNNNV